MSSFVVNESLLSTVQLALVRLLQSAVAMPLKNMRSDLISIGLCIFLHLGVSV